MNDDPLPIVCTECQSSEGPFSNRQRKRGNAAKCTPCIELIMKVAPQSPPLKEEAPRSTTTNKDHASSSANQRNEPKKRERDEESSSSSWNKRSKRKNNNVKNRPGVENNENTGNNNKRHDNNDMTTIEFTTSNDEDHEEETSPAPSFSIRAIKNQILRRDPEVLLPEESSIRNEFLCVICHELLYHAVCLPCGHSHCQHCWTWWEAKQQHNISTCPTCRTVIPNEIEFRPNAVLRSSMEALFPHEMAERRNQLEAGENNGRHAMGCAVILPLEEHEWEPYEGLRVRRSIVLDGNDQCMVYGLALRDISLQTKELTFTICRLHMEQDEAAEGMPVYIDEESDDDCLVIPNDDTEIGIFDSAGPLQRLRMGLVRLKDGTSYSLRHEITGCELQIQRTKDLPHIPRKETKKRQESFVYGTSEGEEERDEETNDSEEDSFLVDESNCVVCREGGELLVCDGGPDHEGGCARSFHIQCIGRTSIPDGDWICQECAVAEGIQVGIEGHEYPDDDDDDEVAPVAQFSESDDDDDTGLRAKAMYKAKRKTVILLDSDDDDSE